MLPLTASYLLLLAIVCGSHLQANGVENLYKMNLLKLSAQGSAKKRDYETKYLEVKVDHFSFTNVKTFPLKYLINTKHWVPKDGPIFLYSGHEGAIEKYCENAGFVWEIAVEFHAAVVFSEHRYYGASLPFGANRNDPITCSQNMAYLSVEQALADNVDLVWYLWSQNNQNVACNGIGPNPVIVFGGSYGGMLAAWLRMKYPATFQGAIASSAPIFGFAGMTNCNSIFNILSSVYTDTSAECAQTILASWKAIDTITEKHDGLKWLHDTWKLCSPLTKDEVSNLKGWLLSVYFYTAMVNYPYPVDYIKPLPGYPVKKLCESLCDHTQDDKTLLTSVFNGINVYFNYTGLSKCLDIYSSIFTDSDNTAWGFQCCTELLFPKCSGRGDDIFPASDWNYEGDIKYCLETFNVWPDRNIMKIMYGGKNLRAATNIIFSNGLLDPWSANGVLSDISETVLAVLIKGAAHHLDLRESNDNDPKSVTEARIMYKDWISKWICEFYEQTNRHFAN